MKKERAKNEEGESLPKTRTGISGLDELTEGGIPAGRPTLICGSAGAGKTIMAMEFIVRGAIQFEEPGVFLSFEERTEELAQNVRSLGFDLKDLMTKKKLAMDYVHIERAEIKETGEYDLEGLFVRIDRAIKSVNAKRVALDTIESLFSRLNDAGILRAELRRLFQWLKDQGVTAVITAERGDRSLTRHGLEEYVSDCVILLVHRVQDQISTRRLRVVKYRGSSHGTNEYPFIIDKQGFKVMPITSAGLAHVVSDERVPTGIPELDHMLGGQGYYKGSSVLVSGTAGTGKTSVAAHFVAAAAKRGEVSLYFAFEESPSQIVRNMKSIGIDLASAVKAGLIAFHAQRPTIFGLETHLAMMENEIEKVKPSIVVVDPISSLINAGTGLDTQAMALRLVDMLKARGITSLVTSLSHGGERMEATEVNVSSLMDTWLLLRDIEINGERNRGLYVLKSRGVAHSNQIREFLISNHGVGLVNVYLGPGGVLTGSSRVAQEAKEKADQVRRTHSAEVKRRELSRKQEVFEARMAELKSQYEAERDELTLELQEETLREDQLSADREVMAGSRHAGGGDGHGLRN
jgi:circadian clock protein KaiC